MEHFLQLDQEKIKENHMGLNTSFTAPALLLSKSFLGAPDQALVHCSSSSDFLELKSSEGPKIFELKSDKF